MVVRPLVHLRESTRLFRAHPLLSLALGLSLAVSVAAVCCGLGILAAPWFGCELYAFQIHAASGKQPPRTRAWFAAGVIILLSALLSVAAASLSGLSLASGPADLVDVAHADELDPRRALLSMGGVILSLLFIMPFTYTPRILVDRGGSLGAAALESARFFVRDGTMRHVGLAFLAHGIQSIPFTVAMLVALFVADPSALPLAIAIASPLLAISIPIGQGVVTCAWVTRRHRLTPAGVRRAEGRPPALLATLVVTLLFAPPLSLALTASSLTRPSRVREGVAPAGELLVDAAIEDARDFGVPATALTVEASPRGLAVVASDGGGAGALPLAAGVELQHIRIVRVRDMFAIELEAESTHTTYLAVVDRAGVRVDDGLARRLADRLPAWALWLVALALLVTPLVLTRVMVVLAELRALALAPREQVSDEELASACALTVRRGYLAMLLLLPIALAALVAGVSALR